MNYIPGKKIFIFDNFLPEYLHDEGRNQAQTQKSVSEISSAVGPAVGFVCSLVQYKFVGVWLYSRRLCYLMTQPRNENDRTGTSNCSGLRYSKRDTITQMLFGRWIWLLRMASQPVGHGGF